MLTLHPQASFTVVRQIANHLDADTYYVKAVIRNAYTDEIIDTLELTDRGEQRFSKNWRVPADSSGQGFYISIVTSVYSDSGYTTKAENYGDEETTYLVQDRLSQGMRGGGTGIDARTVRRIIQEELASLEEAREEVKKKTSKSEEKRDRTDEILKKIEDNDPEKKVKIPTPEKVDLGPVLKAVEAVKQAVVDKAVTPETDLSELQTEISALQERLEGAIEDIKQSLLISERRQSAFVEDTIAAQVPGIVDKSLKKVSFSIAIAPQSVNYREDDEEKEKPVDITRISS